MFNIYLSVAKLLLQRWERAKKVAQVAEETLSRFLPRDNTGDYVVIQKWISEEVSSYECSMSVLSECSDLLIWDGMVKFI